MAWRRVLWWAAVVANSLFIAFLTLGFSVSLGREGDGVGVGVALVLSGAPLLAVLALLSHRERGPTTDTSVFS